MNNYKIINLCERPDLKEKSAMWFHNKWNIDYELYLESINDSLNKFNIIPQWYVVIHDDEIIGGIGVIENDFHNLKHLTPNVCALYVEPLYRGNKIAGILLERVTNDMKEKSIDTLYLVTDHDSFYEKYGWTYLCQVKCDGEKNSSRMYIHKEE